MTQQTPNFALYQLQIINHTFPLHFQGLSGLTFRKDLYLASAQIYPPLEENKKPLTRLQERLIKKLGENAHPFYFELPPHCPASVTLQPAPGDTGKPCGIDYELKAFVGDAQEDKPHKRYSSDFSSADFDLEFVFFTLFSCFGVSLREKL